MKAALGTLPGDDEREREPVITLRMRALPLIDILRATVGRDSDLMWERL